jgi:hypothetical protein
MLTKEPGVEDILYARVQYCRMYEYVCTLHLQVNFRTHLAVWDNVTYPNGQPHRN